MKPLRISHYTLTSALGPGKARHIAGLRAHRTGLCQTPFETCLLDTWTGQVAGLDSPLPDELAGWECRNNRLAFLALGQDGFLEAAQDLTKCYGADRVGVFLGTSTSGIHQSELAYRAVNREAKTLPDWLNVGKTQNIYSCAGFLCELLGLDGVASVISTACSSSAKVYASAYRAMQSGLCDAAIVGGVDSLCLTTLYGFNSLQLLSTDICRPADQARNGISIGEAAGFAIVEASGKSGLALLGYGENSDAYHMSTPDPEGRGAGAAMEDALRRANLKPTDISYINLHGTGTPANDLAEDKAVTALFGSITPCSSTKGWTGHTLGAAGIIEASICLLAIEHGFLPRSLNTRVLDPQLQAGILMESRNAPVQRVLSNSFGFGGSNASLVFGTSG